MGKIGDRSRHSYTVSKQTNELQLVSDDESEHCNIGGLECLVIRCCVGVIIISITEIGQLY